MSRGSYGAGRDQGRNDIWDLIYKTFGKTLGRIIEFCMLKK